MITTEKFLNFKFPLLPYCSAHRGPSTTYNESFHIKSGNTGKQLNFWYCKFRKELCIGLFDKNLHPSKSHMEIVRTKKMNSDEINKICEQYL